KFQGPATQAPGAVREGVDLCWLVIVRYRIRVLHALESRQHCYELANTLEPALCHGLIMPGDLVPSDSSELARATPRVARPATHIDGSGRSPVVPTIANDVDRIVKSWSDVGAD